MGVTPIDGLTAAPLNTRVQVSPAVVRGLKAGWVTFTETMKLALDALRAHKLRSFLTLLGVILALTTLVFVMSVINGLNGYIADKVANLGSNVFIVDRFGIITSRDAWIKAQKRPLVTMEDYERFRDNLKLASAVGAEEDRNIQTRSGNLIMENTSMMGATPNLAEIRNLGVAQG